MITLRSPSFALLTCFLVLFGQVSGLQAQNSDNKPLVAVYPIKPPSAAQTGASLNTANEAIYTFLQSHNLDPNIIVLNIEDGLRKGKKVRLFERGAGGLDSVRQEQFRAECGNGGAQSGTLQSGQTLTQKNEVIDECAKRFAGNAAATGQLSNVEFIVDVAIMDVAIGDAVYEPIPEMPGKFNRNVNCKIDLAVKVLDSTSGQVKFQVLIPAAFIDKRLVQNQMDPVIDWRAIWNRMASEAGRKAAAAINDAIKS